MKITDYIKKLSNMEDLTTQEATNLFQIIFNGGASPAQIASILTSLAIKGETSEEIASVAKLMQKHAIKLSTSSSKPDNIIDICGTGGDFKSSYNISTSVAFVVASCKVLVAKHGNRAVSSQSGSFDILDMLGIPYPKTKMIEMPHKDGSVSKILQKPKTIAEDCLKQLETMGLTFLFAREFHPVMRHVSDVRQDIKIRTIFNLIGPLVNPFLPPYQMIGVFSQEFAHKIAQAMLLMKHVKHATILSSDDGMDEASIYAATTIYEVKNNAIKTYKIHAEQFNLQGKNIANITGGDAKHNAQTLQKIFNPDITLNEKLQDYQKMVILNAGIALYTAGKTSSIKEGAELSRKVITEGKTQELLIKMQNL